MFETAHKKQYRVCDICLVSWLLSVQVQHSSLFILAKCKESFSPVFTLTERSLSASKACNKKGYQCRITGKKFHYFIDLKAWGN